MTGLESQLLGPLGLTVALILAMAYVTRTLFKFITDYIDTLEAKLDEALAGWQEQTQANRVLADAQAARNRDDEMRHRLADASGEKKASQ